MTSGERRETRIIRCPSCQRYYRISAGPPAPGTRLRCTKCGEVFLLADAAAAAQPVASPAAVSPTRPPSAPVAPTAAPPPPGAARAASSGRRPAATGPRVLVATDGVEFQSLIDEVLVAAGYALMPVRTGDEAWEAIRTWKPHVALLDVALAGVPAFELCDRVRSQRELQGIGLILIASVFQQTRYKRAPTSLYGADDYIEKHHIRDWLPGKVAGLLPAGTLPAGAAAGAAPPQPAGAPAGASRATAAPAPEAPHAIIDERERQTLIREELYGSRGREHQGLERLRENLRRYARIIISDIALYNQELVERGIREGTFTELLKRELEEGHRLYLTRVPPSAGGPDHYLEAVQAFIAKRAGAPGAAGPRGKGGA